MRFLQLRVPAVPGEAEKWGFPKAESRRPKTKVPKMPVLHAPYSWKLKAVKEETWETDKLG